MNTAALKTFAIRSRNLLIKGVQQRLDYWGFSPKGGAPAATVEPVQGGYRFRDGVFNEADVPKKWKALREAIEKSSYKEVCEQAAYTWFNRLMALAILEHNSYEPPQLQYLGDATVPAMLERGRRGSAPFLNAAEAARLQPLLADSSRETDAFAGLLVSYCKHHRLLHAFFGGVDDFTELLLPADMLLPTGFLHLLNTSDVFTETDAAGNADRTAAFKKAELIGWLYQFYNAERKDEVFAQFKKNVKASAADIPAATQIFTPAWIVKYMVENTVGRTWLEMHPETPLKANWRYLITPPPAPTPSGAEGGNSDMPAAKPQSLEDLNFADLAAGSGHILTEAFDLFWDCYMEEGYAAGEAVESILTHNLFGLDLDPRAAGLARFALMLKAAKHHRAILTTGPLPQVWAAPPADNFTAEEVQLFLGAAGKAYQEELVAALEELGEAYNLGSVVQLSLSAEARAFIAAQTADWDRRQITDLEEQGLWQKLLPYLRMLNILAADYWCLAANPPYMGQKNMNGPLKQYVNAHYPTTKSDLYAVFIELMQQRLIRGGRMGVLTMESWMFLSSYEKMREDLLANYTINGLAHFGWHIIGIAFGTATLILEKRQPLKTDSGEYSYLKIEDIEREKNTPYAFPKKDNGRFITINQNGFSKIPGQPIAYWVSDKLVGVFKGAKPLEKLAECRKGLTTSKDDLFFRQWTEVTKYDIAFPTDIEKAKKYIPISKGGKYRKWYGNFEHIIFWEKNGEKLKEFKGSSIRAEVHYFQEGVTWNAVSANNFCCRLVPDGFIFNDVGPTIFNYEDPKVLMAYLLSVVAKEIFAILCPTMKFEVGQLQIFPVKKFPTILIEDIAESCISISRADWDSRETSWDFQTSPLVAAGEGSLPAAYESWLATATEQFYALHQNEEELNRIFIGIYGLEEELQPEVPLKDITILQDELDWKAEVPAGELPVKSEVVMQQLISYALGCIMGRYRLDAPGLHIAHPGATAQEVAPYPLPRQNTAGQPLLFHIDEDGIVPLMSGAANFRDDASRLLPLFLSAVWGEESLTQNLNFLSAGLGKPLEQYLTRDFWKAHCSTYSKKPIYWLFRSPKGAFQVLVYMHRLNRFTVSKIRTRYLQEHTKELRRQIAEGSAATDRQTVKSVEQLRKDLADCEQYDELLNSIAWEFEIDLDEGVTRNYARYKGIVAEIK